MQQFVLINVVKILEGMVVETGRQKNRRKETPNWRRKETNMMKAKADGIRVGVG